MHRVKNCWRRLRDDRGSASLEFLTLGVLLMVPLAYLALSLASIHQAALCAEGGARHAARILAEPARADDPSLHAAESAILFALADHGYTAEHADTVISCDVTTNGCAGEDSITVSVTVRASLPLIPASFDPEARASIPVTASATFPMSGVMS